MSVRPVTPAAAHPALTRHAERRAASVQNRIADWITRFAGSMWFVYLSALMFLVWMVWVERKPWPTLTLVVSLEAIFLSTFVMISQNRESARSDIRSQIDFETNVLSEVWLEALADRLGIDVDEVHATARDRIAQAKARQEEAVHNHAGQT
ncbi:MAG TPA: DUF1003 domain-containing protein [Streptosporangiaceae bacterium]